MKRFSALILLLCGLLPAAAGCAATTGEIILHDSDGADYHPTLDPADFVGRIDHPFFTLTPGRVWVYEGTTGEGEAERVEVEVTRDTKVILGITTTVVRDRVWVDGELVEDTRDWFAQDREGNVWYLGEAVQEIQGGVVVGTAGSWEAGVDGALPGIIMKGNPRPGEGYRQEFYPGEAEDIGQVLRLDALVSIGLGQYVHCLQIKEWTPLEPAVVEHKYYCQAVGNLALAKKVAGGSGQIELVEMRSVP